MHVVVAYPIEVDADSRTVAIDMPPVTLEAFKPTIAEQLSSCRFDGSLMDTEELGDERGRAGADRMAVVPFEPKATE
jgi:hypothetical protein